MGFLIQLEGGPYHGRLYEDANQVVWMKFNDGNRYAVQPGPLALPEGENRVVVYHVDCVRGRRRKKPDDIAELAHWLQLIPHLSPNKTVSEFYTYGSTETFAGWTAEHEQAPPAALRVARRPCFFVRVDPEP